MTFKTLDQAEVKGKRVLVRADLNVPMRDGHISDMTRVERVAPTIQDIADRGGRVIVLSHFERPKGKRVPEMSLAPLAEALAEVLRRPVSFADDCIGPVAEEAVAALQDGDVLLLENTRFHKGEEENDPAFSAALAKLGDIYVNDAFSAAHRAHGSTEGVARQLPSYAGRLMQAELEALEAALSKPERPVMAIVGGSKVSTKLDLLGNLLGRVDVLPGSAGLPRGPFAAGEGPA
jgi:phosphoglycerate kinase